MGTQSLAELIERAQTLAKNQNYQQAVQWYDRIILETNEPTDKALHFRREALREKGILLRQMGDQDAALACFEQLYAELGTIQEKIDALVMVGNQSARMGWSMEAIESHQRALRLAERKGYDPGRAQALGGLGAVLSQLEQNDAALSYLQQARALFTNLNNIRGQMLTHNRLGIVYIRTGQLDKAVKSFEEGLVLARLLGQQQTAITLNNLGECYQQLFDTSNALHCHEEAVSLAENLNLEAIMADLYRNLGVDLCQDGQVEAGIGYLYKALHISKQTHQPDIQQQTLYPLGLYEIRRGNVAIARHHAQVLHDMAQPHNAQGYMADALYLQGLVYLTNGELEQCEKHWYEAISLAQQAKRRLRLWQFHASMASLLASPEDSDMHFQLARSVIEQIAAPIEDDTLRKKFLSAPLVKATLQETFQPLG